MISDKNKLDIPDTGSIYFSQMHALRWQGFSQETVTDRLYNEILIHCLLSEAIIITDSHALQNIWMRDLICYDKKYPGILELISKGIILIAKRRLGNSNDGTPLIETAKMQIGKVPVVMGGIVVPMPDNFAPHAKLVDDTSRHIKHHPVYDTSILNLKNLMMEVFRSPEIYKNFGIEETNVAKKIYEMIIEGVFDEGGEFRAAKLYNFKDSDQYFPGYDQQIQNIATSVHSCNFAMRYHIPPATSDITFDHRGVMSVYRTQMPEIEINQDIESRNSIDYINYSTPSFNITSNVVFKVRDTDEFKQYIKCMDSMMNTYKMQNQKLDLCITASEEFADSAKNYLRKILEVMDISIPNNREFNQHYSKIMNSSGGDFFHWVNSVFSSGYVKCIASSISSQEKKIRKDLRTSNSEILYGINRILNIL